MAFVTLAFSFLEILSLPLKPLPLFLNTFTLSDLDEISVSDQKSPTKATRTKTPDNKPPRIIEEIMVKFAVDANLFRLGSINPKKKSSPCFFWLIYRGLIFGWLLSGDILSGGF